MPIITQSSQNNEVNWDDPLNKGLVAWIRPKNLRAYGGTSGDPNADLAQRQKVLVDVPAGYGELSTSEIGLVWDMPGNGSYIRLRSTLFPRDGRKMTWGGWVKRQTSSETWWANNYDGSGPSKEFILASGSDKAILFYRTTGWMGAPIGTADIGRWYHYMGVIDGDAGSVKLFVDGILSNSETFTPEDLDVGTQNWIIKGRANSTSLSNDSGSIGDHRWYDRALTDSEVHDLYMASRTGYQDQFKRRYFPVSTTAPPSNEFTLTAETGSFAIAGNDAGLTYAKSYSITAETGSFALAGNDVDLDASRKLTADSGSFVLTGNSATLTKTTDNTLSAGTGAFALTGNDAGLKVSRKAVADTGSFVLNGNDSVLKATRKASVSTGEFNLSGNNTEVVYTPTSPSLVAGTGEFALSGSDASLVVTRKVVAERGEFDLNGSEAGLRLSRSFIASTGAFTLDGKTTNLNVSRKLFLGKGEFILVGNDARIRYSEEGVTSLIQIKSAFIQAASAAGSISCADLNASISGADSDGHVVTP